MDFVHKFVPGRLPVTLLLLHGSGGDEDDLIPIGARVAPGAGLLSPLGNVIEHGTRRFFPFPGQEGFDPHAVTARVEELTGWLAGAISRYELDSSRLYALGYSNGANMAAAMMLLQPGAIAGACLLRSRAAVSIEGEADLNGAPALISAGQHDPIIPAADAQALGKLLSRRGAHVDFVLQNAGHDLTPADFALAKQWFARLL